MIEENQLKRILEGALLAASEPLSVERLALLFEEQERPDNASIRAALKAISDAQQERGFELKEVASGWRFQVSQDLSPWVGRLWEEKPPRYSRALLETLALVAYRQPVTRGEIEEIRGVAVSSNIIRTLLEREWVRVVGHRDVPGRPAMYATTRSFLDYFNLKNLDELPTLAEIRDLDKINAELGFDEGAPEPKTPESLETPETAGNGESTQPMLEEDELLSQADISQEVVLDEAVSNDVVSNDVMPEDAELDDAELDKAMPNQLMSSDAGVQRVDPVVENAVEEAPAEDAQQESIEAQLER